MASRALLLLLPVASGPPLAAEFARLLIRAPNL
jgi:hypothetical protein